MTRCWVCNEKFGVDGSHICADTPFRVKAQQPAPVQEPCNPLCELCIKRGYDFCANAVVTTPIPPQAQQPRKAVKLTDEEIKDAGFDSAEGRYMLPHTFARAIEAAVWEKLGVIT